MNRRWWMLGLLVSLLAIGFQNCSKGGLQTEVEAYGSNYGFQITAPVCTFNGKVLATGESVTAYMNSTPDPTYGCVSEKRTCLEDGVMTGSYAFASCSQGPRACLFNGITVRSGDSVKAFMARISGNCQSEDRTCQDGRLLGSFPFANCSSTNCLFGGNTIATGNPFNYFSSATVSSSQECPSPFVGVCKDGVLTASNGVALQANQIFPTCQRGAGQCTFRGTPLGENQTFNYNTLAAASGLNFCPGQRVGVCNRHNQLEDAETKAILDGNAVHPSCQPEQGLCQPGQEACPTNSIRLIIADVTSHLCADVQNARVSAGQSVINWSCHRGYNQLFMLTSNYEIKVNGTGLCMEPSNGGVVISNCVGSQNQKWAYNMITRQIRNGNGQCLVASTQGEGLKMAACDTNAANQRWSFPFSDVNIEVPPPHSGHDTAYNQP
jgi:hypothetical protein